MATALSIPFSSLLGMSEEEWDTFSTEKFGMTPDELEDQAFRILFDDTIDDHDW